MKFWSKKNTELKVSFYSNYWLTPGENLLKNGAQMKKLQLFEISSKCGDQMRTTNLQLFENSSTCGTKWKTTTLFENSSKSGTNQLEHKLHCSVVSLPWMAEPTTKWAITHTHTKKKKKTQLTIVLGIDTKWMKRNTSAKTTKHVNMDEQQSEKWMNHLHYHLL